MTLQIFKTNKIMEEQLEWEQCEACGFNHEVEQMEFVKEGYWVCKTCIHDLYNIGDPNS